MNSKKFQKKIENFECEHCGVLVEGNGYTNHCPKCLFSKHVDINPGDRGDSCHGLMRPIGINTLGGKTDIIHQCLKCGFENKNKASEKDALDAETILKLSAANPDKSR